MIVEGCSARREAQGAGGFFPLFPSLIFVPIFPGPKLYVFPWSLFSLVPIFPVLFSLVPIVPGPYFPCFCGHLSLTQKKADLISIMNFREKSLMGILGQTYEQQIITNEAEIPVMVLNPFETRVIRQTPFSF